MRRLVYTPKAYVFIKDHKGVIHDLSKYVTAGRVYRRVDQVSSAEISFRNPDMMFTAAVDSDGVRKPLFRPMDPITIFLERMHGKPVRVFTGYLDSTPYLQLFPGVITVKASCTLKRLQYTYFDAGLPYTRDFLNTYGWTTAGGGQIFSADAYNEFLQKDKNDPLAGPQKKDHVDGSLANLLFATLKHIGNWKTEEIYIEQLPENVFTRLTAFAQEFAKNNKEATDKLKELLKKLAGVGDYGNQDGASPTGTLPPGTGTTVKASVFSPPDAGGTFAGAGTKYPGGTIPGGSPPPPGMYYAELSSNPNGNLDFNALGRIFGASPRDEYGGLAFGTPLRVTYKNKSVIVRKADRGAGGPAGPKIDLWHTAAKALGVDGLADVKVEKLTEAQVRNIEAGGSGAGPARHTTPSNDPNAPAITTPTINEHGSGGAQNVRAKRSGGNSKTTTTEKIYRPIAASGTYSRGYGMPTTSSGHYHIHSGADYVVAAGTPCVAPVDGVITMADDLWSDGGMVHFKFLHDVGSIKAGTIIGWGHVTNIRVKAGQPVAAGTTVASSGNPSGGAHVHFIMRPPGSGDGGGDGTGAPGDDPVPLLDALQKGEANPVDGGGPGGTVAPDGSVTTGPNAVGAAFFGAIELPGILDMADSMLLGGEKSLMNDKPLLPFIQQLCNASLRHFQSLPDGSFYAFFPDYFGEFGAHPPYWKVDDIEILDGNISLNDDALVTHQYVVGDTLSPVTAESPWTVRALASSGVVTVYNMFMADSILNRDQARQRNMDKAHKTKGKHPELDTDPAGMGLLLEKQEVGDFLSRYGARPAVEDMAMIRSPYYEMFLAFQKFLLAWSRQFATPFSLTFMPELFPGGKVGFETHALQMYIEEVQHTWDYESGFTTTATLSAPSVWHTGANVDAVKLLPDNMVNAIIDPVRATP